MKWSHVVLVQGQYPNELPWKGNYGKSRYRTTGYLFEAEGKCYLMTIRSKMISCRNLSMKYYVIWNNNEILYSNQLQIIFQMIEYDIIICTTKNRDTIDFSESVVEMSKTSIESQVPFPEIKQLNKPIIPTKRSKYIVIKPDYSSTEKEFTVNMFQVKYFQTKIEKSNYTPPILVYCYKLVVPIENNKLIGINGACVTNVNGEIVGLVYQITPEHNIHVLPTKTIRNIVHYFSYGMNNQLQFDGLLSLDLPLRVNSKNNIVAKMDKSCIQKNDKIKSINGMVPFIEKKKIFMHDNDLKINLPWDIYWTMNLDKNQSVSVSVERTSGKSKKTKFDAKLTGIPINKQIFPITSQPYFYPIDMIPHINLQGIIIVDFTHELLDIMACNDINLQHDIINNFLNSDDDQFNQNMLVIDCLDNELAKKYSLPVLKNKTDCMLVKSINGVEFKTVKEFHNLIPKNTNIDELVLNVSANKNLVIKWQNQ
jgi:hypothetical protein